MNISGYQSKNIVFSGNNIPQTAKRLPIQSGGVGNYSSGNRDMVTVSLFGPKNNNRIKSLMEQKQSLLERKNDLINSALESGRDVSSIRDMLDSYEEQMKELERQISQEIAGQNGEQPEKIQPSGKHYKPKTRQEIEQERISDLTALSLGLSQARTVQSSQTQVEGEARVLESEIKMDRGRGGDSEILARKEERLAMLQQKSAQLTSEVMEIVGEADERINERRKEEEYAKAQLSEADYLAFRDGAEDSVQLEINGFMERDADTKVSRQST